MIPPPTQEEEDFYTYPQPSIPMEKIYSINRNGICINPDVILNFQRGKIRIKITHAFRGVDMCGYSVETDSASVGCGCKKMSKKEALERIARRRALWMEV